MDSDACIQMDLTVVCQLFRSNVSDGAAHNIAWCNDSPCHKIREPSRSVRINFDIAGFSVFHIVALVGGKGGGVYMRGTGIPAEGVSGLYSSAGCTLAKALTCFCPFGVAAQ